MACGLLARRRSGLEVLVEPARGALPGVGGRRGAVRGAIVRHEAVTRAGVHDDLVGGIVLLQQVEHLAGVGRRGAGVRLAEEAQHGDLDVLGHVEARDGVGLIGIRTGGRPVPDHARLHVGIGRGDLVDSGSAPAPPGDARAVCANTRTLLRPVYRRRDVTQHLLARDGEDDLEDVLDVGELADAALTLEELGSHRVVAGLGETTGHVTDPLVHAPDLRDADDDGRRTARGRPGLVHGHAVAADGDLGITGNDALGVGLDRLGQGLFHADRVAGKGGSGTGLDDVPARQSRALVTHVDVSLPRWRRLGASTRWVAERSLGGGRAAVNPVQPRERPDKIEAWPISSTSFPGRAPATTASRSAAAATTTSTTAPGAAGTPRPIPSSASSTC